MTQESLKRIHQSIRRLAKSPNLTLALLYCTVSSLLVYSSVFFHIYKSGYKIKGLTYDNVVVNLSVYQRENDIFESERLGYVGYSRGITDCWTIGAEMFNRDDRFTSLGGIQHDRSRIFSIHTENRERSLERQFSRI